MKKYTITITQELELPDECSIVECAGVKLIKYGSIYLSPEIEYMQSSNYSDKKMQFDSIEENMAEIIYKSLVLEKCNISET